MLKVVGHGSRQVRFTERVDIMLKEVGFSWNYEMLDVHVDIKLAGRLEAEWIGESATRTHMGLDI